MIFDDNNIFRFFMTCLNPDYDYCLAIAYLHDGRPPPVVWFCPAFDRGPPATAAAVHRHRAKLFGQPVASAAQRPFGNLYSLYMGKWKRLDQMDKM